METTSGEILSDKQRCYVESLYRRGYRYFEKASPIKAEYGGLIYGLERAQDAGIKHLTVYGDSDEVIEHVLVSTVDGHQSNTHVFPQYLQN